MIQKIKKYIKWFFGKKEKFISPAIADEINKEVTDKLVAKQEKIKREVLPHEKFLNDLIFAHLGKPHNTHIEMQTSFDICDKKWRKYVRDINSTSKDISLNKTAFKDNIVRILKNEGWVDTNGTQTNKSEQ